MAGAAGIDIPLDLTKRRLVDAAKEHIAKVAHEFAEKYRIPVTPVIEADTLIVRQTETIDPDSRTRVLATR